MKHILITRFDYPSSYKNIEERIELFRRFTVPSIQNQLCQEFTWAIKTKLPLADLGVECMDVVAVSSFQDAYKLGQGSNRIITTRIDNDDAVHTSYMAKIRFYAEKVKDGTFIDFNGYCYDSKNDKMYRSNKYIKGVSPFVSYVESYEGMHGVYRDNHMKLRNHGEVLKIDSHVWMQIIHDSNQKNKVSLGDKLLTPEQSKELWTLFGK